MTAIDPNLYGTNRRALIMVDAGYVLAVMQAFYKIGSIGDLVIEHSTFARRLVQRVEQQLACPVLRMHWYDATDPTNKVANPRAAAMARVPGVKLRAGRLAVLKDGRFKQKGVDTLLVADMIVHAYQHSVSELVLISGDEDLCPGVDEAQRQGLMVRLWPLQDDGLPVGMSRNLAALVDDHHEIPVADFADIIQPQANIVEAIHLAQEAKPPPPMPSAPVPNGPVPCPPPKPRPLPPKQVLRPVVAFTPLYDLDFNSFHDHSKPADAGHGSEVQRKEVWVDVGRDYVAKWWPVTTTDQQNALNDRLDLDYAGNIPREIDMDLLRFAENAGLDTWGPDEVKFAVRRGFWTGIAEQASA